MTYGDRSVDVFVRKLRAKLHKRSPGWEYVHTHFGIGYRFEPRSLEPGVELPAREPAAEERVDLPEAEPRSSEDATNPTRA